MYDTDVSPEVEPDAVTDETVVEALGPLEVVVARDKLGVLLT
jgi:hypothetical protein